MSKHKPKTLCKNCVHLYDNYDYLCLACKMLPEYCVVTGKNLNAGLYLSCDMVNPVLIPCSLFTAKK